MTTHAMDTEPSLAGRNSGAANGLGHQVYIRRERDSGATFVQRCGRQTPPGARQTTIHLVSHGIDPMLSITPQRPRSPDPSTTARFEEPRLSIPQNQRTQASDV